MSASEDESVDPLEGADVGETAEVTGVMETWVGDYRLEGMEGSDRHINDIDVEAETYTDEHGEHMIRLTFDGEVMKTIPRRWDYSRDPLTEEEEQVARRRKWLGRVAGVAEFVLPFGFSLWLAMQVMNAISGEMTINGEPITAPTFVELAPVVVTVFILSAVIMYGLQGGFPGGFYGGARR